MKTFVTALVTALVASLALATSAMAEDPNLRKGTHQMPAMETMRDNDAPAVGAGNDYYVDPTANRYGDGAPYVRN